MFAHFILEGNRKPSSRSDSDADRKGCRPHLVCNFKGKRYFNDSIMLCNKNNGAGRSGSNLSRGESLHEEKERVHKLKKKKCFLRYREMCKYVTERSFKMTRV